MHGFGETIDIIWNFCW